MSGLSKADCEFQMILAKLRFGGAGHLSTCQVSELSALRKFTWDPSEVQSL